MTYLKQWQDIKKAYDEATADASEKLAAAAKTLKKEKKKSDPDLEYIEELEQLIDEEIVVARKPTGFTQVFGHFDALLPKLEALVEDKVDPTDKKAWDRYIKALAGCQAEMKAANAEFQKIFMKVETYEQKYGNMLKDAKANKLLGSRTVTVLRGKSRSAQQLSADVGKIQRDIAERLMVIKDYLGHAMDSW